MKKYFMTVECNISMNIELEATNENDAREQIADMSFAELTSSATNICYDNYVECDDIREYSFDYDEVA